MVLNIGQAFKMAWRSICGKKGRSALTILSIFIGIAAVMTIVSTMEGMKAKTMEQFAAMGANRIEVSVYAYMYDEGGNPISKDYFAGLYRFCSGLKESIIGITPKGSSNATVVYGTKNSSTMEWKYDQQYNVVSGPPQIYYGSDQYSACNNLAIAKGRDLAWLDCEKYNQICVLGAQAARVFFGSANPVGQIMKVNGNNFEVVGVYGARVEPDTPSAYQTDNFMILPYTATRLLGDTAPTEFLVKAKDDASMKTAGGVRRGEADDGCLADRPRTGTYHHVRRTSRLLRGGTGGLRLPDTQPRRGAGRAGACAGRSDPNGSSRRFRVWRACRGKL